MRYVEIWKYPPYIRILKLLLKFVLKEILKEKNPIGESVIRNTYNKYKDFYNNEDN